MSIKQQDKFNFFVPLEIEKAKDGTGKNLVKIKGVCSSMTEDSDGETLDPTGFDFAPLLQKGFLNWNHQAKSTSKAICGEPTHAAVINNGKDFYIEGLLYDNEEGKAVAELAETLEKNSKTRRLGFSIEGVAQERDFLNPKKIKKAVVSGLAITHVAKNKNTLLQLMKGEYSEPFVEDDEAKDCPKCDHPQLIKGKCLNCGYEEKAIDTAAIAPATPESVEGGHKKINNLVSNNNITNFDKELIKKSDIYISIAKSYPQNSIEQQKIIYNIVEDYTTKILKMELISPESLQKAFDLINEASAIVKSKDAVTETENKTEDVITKSEDAASDEDVEKAMDTANAFHKAKMDKDTACDYMVKSGIAMNVAQGAWEKVIASANAGKEGDQNLGTAVSAPIVKAEEIKPLGVEQIQEEIQKSLEPVALEVSGVKDALTKAFDGYNTVIKSLQGDIQKANETNALLVERLKKVEGEPQPTKSIISASAVERFEKSQDGDVTTDENTYNVADKKDLNKLSDRLFEYIQVNNIQKGENPDALLEGTINSIEATNSVPQYAYARLKAMGIRLVAPSK